MPQESDNEIVKPRKFKSGGRGKKPGKSYSRPNSNKDLSDGVERTRGSNRVRKHRNSAKQSRKKAMYKYRHASEIRAEELAKSLDTSSALMGTIEDQGSQVVIGSTGDEISTVSDNSSTKTIKAPKHPRRKVTVYPRTPRHRGMREFIEAELDAYEELVREEEEERRRRDLDLQEYESVREVTLAAFDLHHTLDHVVKDESTSLHESLTPEAPNDDIDTSLDGLEDDLKSKMTMT
jgi:hypothetical protein